MNPVNQIDPVRPSPSSVDFVGESPHAQPLGPVSAPVPVGLTQCESPSVSVGDQATADKSTTTTAIGVLTIPTPVNATPGANDQDLGEGSVKTARLVDVGAGMTVLVTGAAPVASGAAITVVLPSTGDDAAATGTSAAGGDEDASMAAPTSLQLNLEASPAEASPEPAPEPTDDVQPAPETAGDVQPAPARAEAAPPSLGALLRRPTEIRRDRTQTPARTIVTLPRPCAADIEAIDALYEAGGDVSSLVSSIDQARPYQLPRARYVMTIDTGRAFERMGINKIMASFLKENGNAAVNEQIRLQQIGQISKGRGGELRVKVKTRTACERLARQEVKILGGKYVFQDFDILADRFYIDISSVDSNFDNERLLRAFYKLDTQPIYDTFRDVNLDSGMTTATWRVYFRGTSCPEALQVDGSPCDQVIFGGRVYPAQARDTPFPSQRRGFGQVSPHALQLDQPRAPSPPTTTASTVPTGSGSYADAVKNGVPPSPPKSSDAVSVLSVGTHVGSVLTPPGTPHKGPQPPPSPPRLELPVPKPPTAAGGSAAPKGKGKRSRYADDFENLLQKARPKAVEGIATSNYFEVLRKVEFHLDCCHAKIGESSVSRYHVVPRKVKGPEEIKTSTESSHFLSKNHTKVERTKEATSIQEILAELAMTEQTADLQLQPNHLAAADARADAVRKTLRNTANADTVQHLASVKEPLAFNSVLLGEMNDLGHAVGDLAQLHMINRVLSATDPNSCTTFAHKWSKHYNEKVPATRNDIFRRTGRWYRNTDMAVLLRATKALSLFELMLMCTAPDIFKSDMWIQRLTGRPVSWIPALNGRLLHPNTLLVLLRSELGALMFKAWESVQWQGELLEDLEYLRDCGLFFPDDEAVLQLTSVDGVPTLGAGPLCLDC